MGNRHPGGIGTLHAGSAIGALLQRMALLNERVDGPSGDAEGVCGGDNPERYEER